MKAARTRLIVAAVLMVGWLGYLGFLALGHSQPIVVSRSQLLQATHFVKVEVKLDSTGKPELAVRVRESFGANRIAEETIEIDNLAHVRVEGKPLNAGDYFIPLIAVGPNRYRVVAPAGTEKFMAYPWTPEVEKQVRELVR